MRKCFIFVIALVTLGTFAEMASAKTREIGYHDKSAVGAACDKAGGKFYSDGLIHQCSKENCDGKGGSCSVTCNAQTQKCFGSTPLVKGTLPIRPAAPTKVGPVR